MLVTCLIHEHRGGFGLGLTCSSLLSQCSLLYCVHCLVLAYPAAQSNGRPGTRCCQHWATTVFQAWAKHSAHFIFVISQQFWKLSSLFFRHRNWGLIKMRNLCNTTQLVRDRLGIWTALFRALELMSPTTTAFDSVQWATCYTCKTLVQKEKTSIWCLLEVSLRADSEQPVELLVAGLSAGWHIQVHSPHLQMGAVINSFSFVGRPGRTLIRKGKLSVVGRTMARKNVYILITKTCECVTWHGK